MSSEFEIRADSLLSSRRPAAALRRGFGLISLCGVVSFIPSFHALMEKGTRSGNLAFLGMIVIALACFFVAYLLLMAALHAFRLAEANQRALDLRLGQIGIAGSVVSLLACIIIPGQPWILATVFPLSVCVMLAFFGFYLQRRSSGVASRMVAMLWYAGILFVPFALFVVGICEIALELGLIDDAIRPLNRVSPHLSTIAFAYGAYASISTTIFAGWTWWRLHRATTRDAHSRLADPANTATVPITATAITTVSPHLDRGFMP